MQTLSIPLSQVISDPQLQPRVGGLDPEHVRELEEAVEWWPPLRVVSRGGKFLLVDGSHRLAAAKNRGLDKVAVTVLEVPDTEDLRTLAFALNATHGRPLTLSDRRAFAGHLLREHPNWSDREIGRRSGLVQPTVAKVRNELERNNEIQPADTRIGRDGRSYPATSESDRSGVGLATLLENITTVLDPSDQRRLVRFLEKAADVLEEQGRLKHFETFESAAKSCRALLGEEQARELAERLGWSAGNIFQIAIALGYREGDEP